MWWIGYLVCFSWFPKVSLGLVIHCFLLVDLERGINPHEDIGSVALMWH